MDSEVHEVEPQACSRPGCGLKAKADVCGYKLCNLCKAEVLSLVDEAVAAGRQRAFTRAKWGQRWPAVVALIKRVGYADSKLLQEHFGMTPEQARDYLHEKKKRGWLVYARDEGRFFLGEKSNVHGVPSR